VAVNSSIGAWGGGTVTSRVPRTNVWVAAYHPSNVARTSPPPNRCSVRHSQDTSVVWVLRFNNLIGELSHSGSWMSRTFLNTLRCLCRRTFLGTLA
jgi:hypothetical protein